MMRRLAVLILIVSWISCINKTKTPPDIIPRDKMTGLIWDVILVDQYSKEHIRTDSLKEIKKERSRLYQEVFDLHKTSREAFLKSFNYYLSRPDLTKTIFDSLAIRGSRQRENLFHIRKPRK